MFEPDPKAWAEAVFGQCALGDRRRTRRLVDYAAREAAHMSHSTSAACDGDDAAAEGAYRLLRNRRVDAGAIAEGGFQATVEAAQACRELLAVEDSTTLSYQHSAAKELGDLGGKKNAKRRGFWVHSVLLVDGDSELTVGLVHQDRWRRDPKQRKGSKKWRKPSDAKESEKWELASACVAERMGDLMTRTISVCDREADIYQYVAWKKAHHQRFIVRSCNDRSLEPDGLLWGTVKSSRALGTMTIQVQQRGGQHGRTKREVTLSLRSLEATLKRPKYLGKQGDAPEELVTIWAVHAIEESPPEGQAPLEWLLLTSESVPTFDDASRVLRYYALRWRIEEFHKAWKSGCGVEDRRNQHADNLERVAAITMFVAVRLLQLNEYVAASPETPCDVILAEDEWHCLWVTTKKSRPPKKVPSMRWARDAIARLGGWLNTKGTGRVAWSTMWKGWRELASRVEGARAMMALRAGTL
jgi:transposase-like protein/transposase Tn5 family protein